MLTSFLHAQIYQNLQGIPISMGQRSFVALFTLNMKLLDTGIHYSSHGKGRHPVNSGTSINIRIGKLSQFSGIHLSLKKSCSCKIVISCHYN